MINKRYLLSAIFLFFVSFAMASVPFSSPDKAILVSKNKPTFKLYLKSNPTTGYSWFLADYDDDFIEPVSQQYVAPNTKMVGAGGYEVWTFKVLPEAFKVPQLMTIKMLYTRPWKKEHDKPIKFKLFS